jgi:LuxR family transcriptional regulator, maltose regulon positive regulatory protein
MTALATIGIAPPRPPHATVRRPRLVGPLCERGEADVAVLVAPAGYGKTTVLCEWAARDPRPFAWVTLDARDNEPLRLLSRISRATDAARAEADEDDGAFVLVLDDVHVLHTVAAVEVLSAVATDLPPEAMLAVASRREPPLPVPRLRAQRRLIELRAADLALAPTEVATLLRREGSEADRDALARVTEGWPAAVSLALLAGEGFGGDDELVTDYVTDELLADLPADARTLLRRTSVLDVLTGPACDAVLRRSGSAAVLDELVRANVLLVALDRRGERYRHHRLLATTLRRELRRVEPELEPELHRRASAFHRRTGDVDGAVRHALAARDVRTAAAIVWRHAATEVCHGRAATLDRWLERFTPRQVAVHAPLALAAAIGQLAAGRGDLVEHWTTAAASAAGREPEPVLAAGIAALRASAAHHGLAAARADAEQAIALQPDDGPCHALCRFVAGVAAHLSGDREAAAEELAEGVRRAAVTAPSLHALCLAQLAVLALEREDWEAAAGLVTRARAQVDRFDLGADCSAALVFAVSALVRAHRGRVEEARHDLREATRLAAELTDFAPWYEVELALVSARAALRLCDIGDADARIAAAARLLRLAPEAVVLADWLADAREQLVAFAGPTGAPPSSLTTAELRILRYLPTHLSFREIAERTYVSANTVKTQANAVYRKLDVSCRSEAVSRARELGLLDTVG